MTKKECLSIILAGGQGTRLAALTTQIAKPAIPFGGRYRLIDFTLSNCYNSGIDTVGVLTSSCPFKLDNQMSTGRQSELYCTPCTIHTLPPIDGSNSYDGTANAVYKNIDVIERFSPEYVLILSGDHIYRMDYNLLLSYHKSKGAVATIATVKVPWAEASRFGILGTHSNGVIADFTEKPTFPRNNTASMGVYIFSWSKLKYYLRMDQENSNSSHDFGKNIIPAMIAHEEAMFAYPFNGYWKDVGTVASLYEAHMDLLSDPPGFDIEDMTWPIYSTLPHITASIDHSKRSLISDGSSILGQIDGSIIFADSYIGKRAKVKNSVIMPGAYIGIDAYIENAIIGPAAIVENGCTVYGDLSQSLPIAIVGEKAVVSVKKDNCIVTQNCR
jgi:glucose-1-phosphate adenylyltransferase